MFGGMHRIIVLMSIYRVCLNKGASLVTLKSFLDLI